LNDLLSLFKELMHELNNTYVIEEQKRFRKLMKEQSDLTTIVETYKAYKEAKQTVEDSVLMLEEKNDEEMREMLKEELAQAKKDIECYKTELKILLLPKDSKYDKNVIVENCAGAG